MIAFIVRRLFASIPVIVGVVTLVFLLTHLVPGDPVDIMLGESATAEDRAHLRQQLGLNEPLPAQYVHFWKQIFNGTWGESLTRGQSVFSLVWERFVPTLILALSALFVALCVSLPLGVVAARFEGRWPDVSAMVLALLGGSIPIMVLAPVAVLVGAIKLRWFPVAGYGSFMHLVLPSLCLGLSLSGLMSRMLRTAMVEVLGEDYIRFARARGLSEVVVLCKHALRNALLPVLTILGNILGGVLAGAVLTETIFDWPGLGKLLFSAFQSRDYPLVQGCVLWIALSYVMISLLVDLAYSVADPRIRLGGTSK